MPKAVVAEADRRRRRPTKQGVVLSERMIVETALRMVREHGPAGLSARRLGLALGADASTVYRYFRGMDELTLALGDELMRLVLAQFRPTGDWREDLNLLGLGIHRVYLEHPQAAVLTASRVSGRANELAGDEAILASLRGAGFPDSVAVRIYHVFIDQCLAFAALDAAALVLPEPALQSDQRMWRATYAHLPTSTHPNLRATSTLLAKRMNDSAYPAALKMVLDSAEAELAAILAGRRGTRGGKRAGAVVGFERGGSGSGGTGASRADAAGIDVAVGVGRSESAPASTATAAAAAATAEATASVPPRGSPPAPSPRARSGSAARRP